MDCLIWAVVVLVGIPIAICLIGILVSYVRARMRARAERAPFVETHKQIERLVRNAANLETADPEAALAALNEALVKAQHLLDLADTLEISQGSEELLRRLLQGVQLQRDSLMIQVRMGVGRSFVKTGKLKEALEALNEVLSTVQDVPDELSREFDEFSRVFDEFSRELSEARVLRDELDLFVYIDRFIKEEFEREGVASVVRNGPSGISIEVPGECSPNAVRRAVETIASAFARKFKSIHPPVEIRGWLEEWLRHKQEYDLDRARKAREREQEQARRVEELKQLDARRRREQLRRDLEAAEELKKAERWEEAAKIYDKYGMHEEAGEARRRARTTYIEQHNVNLDINKLVEQRSKGAFNVVQSCPTCGRPLPAIDGSSEQKHVKCGNCGNTVVIGLTSSALDRLIDPSKQG